MSCQIFMFLSEKNLCVLIYFNFHNFAWVIKKFFCFLTGFYILYLTCIMGKSFMSMGNLCVYECAYVCAFTINNQFGVFVSCIRMVEYLPYILYMYEVNNVYFNNFLQS